MRLGMGLPTAGTSASTDAISRVAEGAEQIGLHSVWAFERQLSPSAVPSAVTSSSRAAGSVAG